MTAGKHDVDADFRVERLSSEDIQDIVDVLCDSFQEYPVMRFVLGSPADYEDRLRTLVHFFVMARVLRDEVLLEADNLRTASPYKDDKPGWNRSQFYGEFNTSKRSLALDISNAFGNNANTYSVFGGYPARPGWDACTGLGRPFGKALLAGIQRQLAP